MYRVTHRPHAAAPGEIMMRVLRIVVLAVVCTSCSGLGRSIANFQYGQLDLPIDREAALTVASFPPSADIRAVIGGRGEGLDCSIPSVLQALMFSRVASADSPVALQFRQGCVSHDYCYRHGSATYGYTQADCDFNLLEHSFRTCIQIYDVGWVLFPHSYAGTKTIEICRARAREVLLGVRIGGHGSFRSRDESSYFEFDPMPIHADDYTVGRLARLDANRGLIVVDGRRLMSTPSTFHFERGRVKTRQLQWSNDETKPLGDGDLSSATVFPDFASPTPPSVVRLDGEDQYVWLTRGKPFTTGFNVMVVDPSSQGDPSFRLLPCPKAEPTARVPKPQPKCDFDSSVIRVVQASDPSQRGIRFFAFTHRFADKTDGRNRLEKDTIGVHWWEMAASTLTDTTGRFYPVPSPAKLKNVSSHQYRFLQSELHVGEFREAGCSEVVALGRGIILSPSDNPKSATADEARTADADQWEEGGAVGFIPLGRGNCPTAAQYQILLPQSAEPAVPVNKGLGKADRLLTVSSRGEHRPVRITEYSFRDKDSTKNEATVTVRAVDSQGLLAPLDNSWVKSAAYVVRRQEGTRGDRLFFSRVLLDADQARRYNDGQAPESIQIQFRYFDASETGWVERAYSSCAIDLNMQHDVRPQRSLIRSLLKRLAFEGVKRKEDEPQADELFRRLHKRELVRQWMQSQVIPGYIFAADGSTDDRPIDATVIFHGSPDYSLLLEGISGSNASLDRFEIRRPAGRVAFAHCG